MNRLTLLIVIIALVISILPSTVQAANTNPNVVLDGSGSCSAITSCNPLSSLTTTSTNDVIIVAFPCWSSGSNYQCRNARVSDTSGLTWVSRFYSQFNNTALPVLLNEAIFYARVTKPLSGDTVTGTCMSGDLCRVMGFALAGIDQQTPFDTSSQLPEIEYCKTSLCNSANFAGTVAASGGFSNDVFIVVEQSIAGACSTAASDIAPFTLITNDGPNGMQDFYYAATTQTRATLTCVGGNPYHMTLDALCAYPCAGTGGSGSNAGSPSIFQVQPVQTPLGIFNIPVQLLAPYIVPAIIIVSAAIIISSLIGQLRLPIITERRLRKQRRSSLI